MSETPVVKIEQIKRLSQLVSFDGMKRLRGIYPTDIDGIVCYNGKALIVYETKLEGTPLKYAQMKFFREELSNTHMEYCFVLSTHKQYDTSKPIQLKETKVVQMYINKEEVRFTGTALQATEYFENYCINKGIEI